jgi:hypothetical protein
MTSSMASSGPAGRRNRSACGTRQAAAPLLVDTGAQAAALTMAMAALLTR